MTKMRKKSIVKKQAAIPEALAQFVNNVCERQRQCGTSIRPPHMIIPLSSGNGRSFIAQTIAHQYYKANVLKFSSTDICLDFTMKETVQRVSQIDTDIQANSGCTNEFCGVVALAIDDLLGHLREMPGNKFFELVAKIKVNATLIIFVPSNISRQQLAFIYEKTGAGVKVFSPIEYSDDDFTKFFYDALPPDVVPLKTEDVLHQNKKRINAYIAKNIRNKTIKSVKESAEAVFYDEMAIAELFDKNDIANENGGVWQ